MSEAVLAPAAISRRVRGMDKLDELQARRLEKAKRETPPDLAEELFGPVVALKPILDRLEHDLKTQ
jgi:hypothetical protein